MDISYGTCAYAVESGAVNKEELHRRVNAKMTIAYFSCLALIQAFGAVYFLMHPSVASVVAVGLLLVLTPVALEMILVRVMKTLYRGMLSENP